MVAPASSHDRVYRVFWQFHTGSLWQSATFFDRDEAMACFFRWMGRGLTVRWSSAAETG
jgi:hypothetical protein